MNLTLIYSLHFLSMNNSNCENLYMHQPMANLFLVHEYLLLDMIYLYRFYIHEMYKKNKWLICTNNMMICNASP